MPFPADIRIRALIASARHCCICHRYKGLKVEVHHIVPLEKGGSDEADNAIVLCFDCHTDAGHYNPDHPRGTKFSTKELRMARDSWHRQVEHNQIQMYDKADKLYCRYLICKSFSAQLELIKGDLTQFRVDSPHLAKTKVWDFLKNIIRRHSQPYGHGYVPGRSYASQNDYSLAHPNAHVFEYPSSNLYPYFAASRVPSRDEITKEASNLDYVTARLLDEGVAVEELAEAFVYTEVCGDGELQELQEIFRLRPLWAAFLAATNLGSMPIRVRALECQHDIPNGWGYRPFSLLQAREPDELSLPAISLPPNATAIVPIATLLGPLSEVDTEQFRCERFPVPSGEIQTTEHCNAVKLREEISLIGPALWPIALVAVEDETDIHQQIHELDLTNLYIIERDWEAGCCPHVFFQRIDSSIAYHGEIWSEASSQIQIAKVAVPDSVSYLIVAELEEETTEVYEICVNGQRILSNLTMSRGDFIRIPVSPNDSVVLSGSYRPNQTVQNKRIDPWWKNNLVNGFISMYSDGYSLKELHWQGELKGPKAHTNQGGNS